MAEKKIVTPDLGGSADVTVIDILVSPGDRIEVDTPVVELESDKATMEVPTTEAGVVKAINVKKGDSVNEGDVLITVDAAVDAKAVQPAKETKSEAPHKKAATKSGKATVVTPDLGGDTDVTVINIMVKAGDTLEVDAPVVELESDKATMEVPTTMAGKVSNINVKVGDKVNEGDVLVTLDAEAADVNEAAGEEESESVSHDEAKTILTPEIVDEDEADANVLTGDLETDSDVHAGPGVRRFARELGVNLKQVPGSGPKQRILKEDVQAFVKGQLTSSATNAPAVSPLGFPPAPVIDFSKFGPVDVKELSRIQKISGKNLARNWATIPHVTQFGEADITSLEEFRKQQKNLLDKQSIKMTPIVFVMKAVVSSLKAFPHFNASLDASGENLVMKKYFHIGVAVDTPNGLVVPIIRDVDKKGLIELAKELGDISEKARNKQLTPQDMQGGSISISSLGGIGGTAFTPIINAPEVAILGVSRTAMKPVYEDGEFVPRLMLPLSLSYDHRVIDGADGARFMVHLTHMLSDIRNLLM